MVWEIGHAVDLDMINAVSKQLANYLSAQRRKHTKKSKL